MAPAATSNLQIAQSAFFLITFHYFKLEMPGIEPGIFSCVQHVFYYRVVLSLLVTLAQSLSYQSNVPYNCQDNMGS